MASKDLWIDLQNLSLGSEKSPLVLSHEAKKKRDEEHNLSLVVKGTHPSQNPAGIKVMMPKIWKLDGRINSRINEDGTVQFFFRQKHQLLTILDDGPWTYKDWLVIVDQWTRRHAPDYLKVIPFWVNIHNIPDDSRNPEAVTEVGEILGQVKETVIQQPTANFPGEVRARINIDAYGRIVFTSYVRFDDPDEPTLVRFTFNKLRKFCSTCGSLTHIASSCTLQPIQQVRTPAQATPYIPDQEVDMEIASQTANTPVTPAGTADDIMGETVGSSVNMGMLEGHEGEGSPKDAMDCRSLGPRHSPVKQAITIKEHEAPSTMIQEKGTKRKGSSIDTEDNVSTNRRKFQEPTTDLAKGEVDTPKPPLPK